MSQLPLTDDFETLTKHTFYLVEATNFERMILLKEYTDNYRSTNKVLQHTGWMRTLDQRTTVKFSWCILYREGSDKQRLICFWEPTSRVVDYGMIEEYLAKTFPKVPQCDANNFHNHCGASI